MTDHPCYANLLGLICSVFESYSVVLLLPKPGTDKYRVAAYFSLGDDIDKNSEIVSGKGLAGWVLRDQNPLLVNNVDQTQGNLGYYRGNNDSSIKAFMACPLGDGRGAICLDSKRQYSFSDKDQKILQLFASIINDIQRTMNDGAASIEIVNYYTKLNLIHALRDKFSRWNIFLQHFLQILSEATGFSFCFFVARSADGAKYYLEGESQPNLSMKNKNAEFPMGSGLLGWVFRDGSPLFAIAGEAALNVPLFGKGTAIKSLQAVACLPLNINNITRGVLCLAHDKPIIITQEMKDFLNMASDHLALFLENLYLKSKLHEARSRLRPGNSIQPGQAHTD